MGRKQLPQPNVGQGSHIRAEADVENPLDHHPIFDFHLMLFEATCNDGHKARLLEHLGELSGMTWRAINAQVKEQWGFEKIPIKQFPKQVQHAVPEDVKNLWVGRLSQKWRFAGYRTGRLFFVILLDPRHESY